MLDLSSFAGVIVASGTPSSTQKSIGKYKGVDHVMRCTPCRAIEDNIICKPCLNLICEDVINQNQLVNATISVVEREKILCNTEPFKVKTLVCACSIDQANQAAEELRNREPNWHVVVLHSSKKVGDDTGAIREYKSSIDGNPKTSNEVFDYLDKIDEDLVYTEDNEPIIVFQVDMISEGVNIKSFNSVIISSNSDTKQMQQTGRVLRDCKTKDNKRKVDYGHASIYAYYNNKENLYNMIMALAEQGLEWDWGEKCDIKGTSPNTSDLAEESIIKWAALSKIEIEELTSYKTKGAINNSANNNSLEIALEGRENLINKMWEILGKSFKRKINKTQSNKSSVKTKSDNSKVDDSEKIIEEKNPNVFGPEDIKKLYTRMIDNVMELASKKYIIDSYIKPDLGPNITEEDLKKALIQIVLKDTISFENEEDFEILTDIMYNELKYLIHLSC